MAMAKMIVMLCSRRDFQLGAVIRVDSSDKTTCNFMSTFHHPYTSQVDCVHLHS